LYRNIIIIVLLMLTECREFQARVTRQVATACVVKPEPESEMFGVDVPERERTTLGSLRELHIEVIVIVKHCLELAILCTVYCTLYRHGFDLNPFDGFLFCHL